MAWETQPFNTLWQQLYPPAAVAACLPFGIDDSLSPVSYGDGNTSGSEGYMWNMWRRYDCCEQVGQTFLFTL
jgi:hypothetical protein